MSEVAPVASLVLLHGFAGGPESWNGVRSHLRAPWSKTKTVVPYLAGHGEQSARLGLDGANHSFEAEVDRLAGICREPSELGEPRVLVGYSLGARLGLGLLVRYPSLFQRAILVGVNPGLESVDERRARSEQDERLAQLAIGAGLEAFLEHWENLPLFNTQASLPTNTRSEQALIRRRNTAPGLALSLRTCGLSQMPNYTPKLRDVQVPLELVVGQHDERFVELARRMSAVLPRSSVHVLPGCGHNVLLEAPAALAAIIQASP